MGSENERGLDISKLRSQSGAITLDEGYVNTGSTTSSITYLDGEQGILRYRGYPIEVLAEKCDFVEVSYLLIYGKLPTADELETFRRSLAHHRRPVAQPREQFVVAQPVVETVAISVVPTATVGDHRLGRGSIKMRAVATIVRVMASWWSLPSAQLRTVAFSEAKSASRYSGRLAGSANCSMADLACRSTCWTAAIGMLITLSSSNGCVSAER